MARKGGGYSPGPNTRLPYTNTSSPLTIVNDFSNGSNEVSLYRQRSTIPPISIETLAQANFFEAIIFLRCTDPTEVAHPFTVPSVKDPYPSRCLRSGTYPFSPSIRRPFLTFNPNRAKYASWSIPTRSRLVLWRQVSPGTVGCLCLGHGKATVIPLNSTNLV